ncbi:hypothetical protein [Arcobacter cloacae]|uniref:Uncharacterized protein n=1 Tax=Arcobacter cloacae TaxID=1054034 RepID=A0A6M8NT13_9BACT|nr:hypothetical protein [Arcobacter cloacae]QKF89706.1 hypothetical protein ACLO_1205 [Arcobacter cloacae]RXI40703.1 hypothetical protein CP963_07965 [Arcobacter cloacae]
MFSYKNYITLNSKFSKSTNIIHDSENCENYILTTSAQNVLKVLFKLDYHNSISLIGPFGCGKSTLLLYINTLLSNNEHQEKCIKKLKDTNSELYNSYKSFLDNKSFLRIKIVGEHISFKSQLKAVLQENKDLKLSNKYLKEESFSLNKLLEFLNKDIEKSLYTNVLFSIDEFGKFIEYGLEDHNSNDIFELQTLSEYVNKKDNFKLIVSLHKSFNEYNLDSSAISYSDWDKIQGRFENIVFKDDYYEMLNIFKETITLKESNDLVISQNIVKEICSDKSFNKNIDIKELENLFEKIIPIHPYSVLIIAEIFSKYFQNQRSIYSFIFSSEPNGFQDFIETEFENQELYGLSNLYDYVAYLLRVYSIVLPDSEAWYFSEDRLKDNRVENKVQKDIIKTISLIHTFKLSNTVLPNSKHIVLSLIDKYNEEIILQNIDNLEKLNLLIFQEQTQSYSLLADSNIDINKELRNLTSKNITFNYELEINKIIKNKEIIAKRYFSEYGSKRVFEKIYVCENEKVLKNKYKIFIIDANRFDLKDLSLKNNKSLFLSLKNSQKLNTLVEKVEALKIIKNDNKEKVSINTIDILDNMILDSSTAIDTILTEGYISSNIYHNGLEHKFSSKTLQKLISDISMDSFPDTPKINNYTLNHTIANKGTSTTFIKALFDNMLENPDQKDLGIEKFPAEKALYLSIIKPSGIHRFENNAYALYPPNDLNFENVWNEITKSLKKRTKIVDLVTKLEEEPYGLDRTKSLFMISLFIIVNKESINIFRDNTYIFDLSLDMLMNMWKATDKFELQIIKLSKDEENLFKVYVQLTTDLTDSNFTKEKVSSIISTLHSKFSYLPEYAHRTMNLSKEAISLRTELVTMREPTKSFFESFPKALGFEKISNIDNDEFIQKFRKAFNEIALSYKEELLDLEKYISSVFLFKTTNFPYGNSLIEMSEKLSKIDGLDYNSKAIVRCFTYSNSIVEFVDGLSMILIRKKLEQCYDNDVTQFKEKLSEYAEKLLSKLELTDIAQENQDVRKISLTSLDKSLNKIISINKNEIDRIDKKVAEIKKSIPNNFTNDQKLYLISQLLNEEFNNE